MEWSNGEMRLIATFLPVARWIALHTIPYAPSPNVGRQRRGQRGGREWSTDNVDDLVVFATVKIVHNLDVAGAGEVVVLVGWLVGGGW